MTSKKNVKALVVLCIVAIFAIALCGCEDLGAYEDTEEYYATFDDIVMIEGTSREERTYSVEDYFYNEQSREDFLEGEDGVYNGVEHSDYVYMAIPLECDIDMDSIALYIQSLEDVTVYINVYVTDKIPTAWKSLADNEPEADSEGETDVDPEGEPAVAAEIDGEGENTDPDADQSESTENKYDDPDPETRVGEITVHLNKGNWSSFVLDSFKVDGAEQKSIQIKSGEYILLQFRNNSGVRVFDEERQVYLDPQTGLELQKAQISLTNMLIRALDLKNVNEVQGGE